MQILLDVFPYLIGTSLAVVLAVLFAGLFAMLKGEAADSARSNRLMRWRVASQATAVVLSLIYVLLLRL